MSRLTVQVGGIASPAGISDPATIVIEDGRIDSIAAGHDRPAHGPLFDARGEIAGPGLIDVHTHGAGGAQAIDGAADIDTMSRFYAAHGVTGFLASVGGTAASIERGLSGVRQTLEGGRGLHKAGSPAGARCLGAHLEGPFIDPSQPGAFRPDTIVAPDVALLEHMIGIAGGSLRLITLAPEQPGAAELIRTARASGVVCAAGHSSASAAAMEEAIEHGVSHVTHLFNAMPGFHHRSPGLVGVALSDPRLTVEVIADGVHLDPRTVRLIARAKPWAEIVLITDSVGATGLGDGKHHVEEQDIEVRGGQARLTDGTLAGSTLTLDVAVRNHARFGGIAWVEALGSATTVPARLLGLDGRMGSIEAGFDADLVGFDREREVVWTIVGGALVYER